MNFGWKEIVAIIFSYLICFTSGYRGGYKARCEEEQEENGGDKNE